MLKRNEPAIARWEARTGRSWDDTKAGKMYAAQAKPAKRTTKKASQAKPAHSRSRGGSSFGKKLLIVGVMAGALTIYSKAKQGQRS